MPGLSNPAVQELVAMALTRRIRRPGDLQLNMAPMIDIVFLLNIFFIRIILT